MMIRPTSSLLLICKISNFMPPEESGYEAFKEDLGTKNFSAMLGDKKLDWKLKTVITYKGIKIYFKNDSSKFKDFYTRITCMIHRSFDDDQEIDYEGSMCTEYFTCHGSSFVYNYKPLFMKFDDLGDCYGYMLNDYDFNMYIKIDLMEQEFPKELKKQKVSQPQYASFADLYQTGDFSDFTVICSDGAEIPVHRSILYANSPVLKAMMLTDMQESKDSKLQAPDIDGAVMNKIMSFMYTQKIDNISDHLKDLLYGAEKYQIDSLKAVCIDHMFNNLRAENVVEYLMLAELYDVERLCELSLTYIQIHYDALKSSGKLDELNGEQLKLIEKAVKDYKACGLSFEFDMDPEKWGHVF